MHIFHLKCLYLFHVFIHSLPNFYPFRKCDRYVRGLFSFYIKWHALNSANNPETFSSWCFFRSLSYRFQLSCFINGVLTVTSGCFCPVNWPNTLSVKEPRLWPSTPAASKLTLWVYRQNKTALLGATKCHKNHDQLQWYLFPHAQTFPIFKRLLIGLHLVLFLLKLKAHRFLRAYCMSICFC